MNIEILKNKIELSNLDNEAKQELIHLLKQNEMDKFIKRFLCLLKVWDKLSDLIQ